MLIIVLAVCAGVAVLAIDLITKLMTKPAVLVEKVPLPEWCHYDYLGELRATRLSKEELADLEDIADRGCELGWPAREENLAALSAEDKAHIRICAQCQSILDLRNEPLPE